jgi:hypothetical protein
MDECGKIGFCGFNGVGLHVILNRSVRPFVSQDKDIM